MRTGPYRGVMAVPAARRVLIFGLLVRIPTFAGSVILALHVVAHLHRSYAQAGLVVAVLTVALAIGAPWRGRELDRHGLRRTVAPSVVVLAACWSVAPWVGYPALVALVGLAGAFWVPTFSIVRQALIAAVADEDRRAALALDSVAIEAGYMVSPALGVLAVTLWGTPVALFVFEMAMVGGCLALWVFDPALSGPDGVAADSEQPRSPRWVSPNSVAVLAAATAGAIVLTGIDLGVVAALRHGGEQSAIGWVLGCLGLGSAVGGLVYGALHRGIPVFALLALLSAATLPAALTGRAWQLAVALAVAGLFAAPVTTAATDELSRLVPPGTRGEAMGWLGSCLTAGAALSAPLAGWAIDAAGWRAAFVVCAGVSVLVAAGGLVAAARSSTV